jgi:Uma2 family endonuclease
VSCTAGRGTDLLIPGVVVIFEVISPNSARLDRVVKLREYQGVPSIRRYVILESTQAVLTVLSRTGAIDPWTATGLTRDDTLHLPELGIEVPVAEFYEGVDLPDDEDSNVPLNPVATT